MAACGRDDLARDLRALGLAAGDGVFVHTALGSVGHVVGGPRGMIEALVETVGDDGLVAMPGFSADAYDPCDAMEGELSDADRRRVRSQVPGFDPLRSDARGNGSVPEAFRTWPGVVRSPHPTSSVLLLGRDASDLATPHDAGGWATGPETSWGRLRQRTAMKILLIGVGWNRCSALHAAETLADHRRTKLREFKAGPDGPWINAPDVADDLDTLFPLVGAAWEKEGGCCRGTIGGAEAILTGYDALVEFATRWLDDRNCRDGIVPFGLEARR